jgi:Flp pilus assembly protein TadB
MHLGIKKSNVKFFLKSLTITNILMFVLVLYIYIYILKCAFIYCYKLIICVLYLVRTKRNSDLLEF